MRGIKHSLNLLFHIQAESGNDTGNVLLMEVGEDYCCYAFCDETSKSVNKLKYLSLKTLNNYDVVEQILKKENLAAETLNRICICSALHPAILFPKQYFNEEVAATFLTVTYDLKNVRIAQDEVSELGLILLYALPEKLLQPLHNNNVQYIHAYSTSLKSSKQSDGETDISVHFTPKYFRVILKKQQQLNLVQTYSYTVPLDVVYYLIRMFDEFKLSQQETHIILSGLIQEDSALFKELHGYFLNVHFDLPGDNTVDQQEYPQHFFTSMYNLAACVL
ncbi:MAG: DUF3822 family protein [Chitinophagaceae bacterium]